jgi:hypothetical protein
VFTLHATVKVRISSATCVRELIDLNWRLFHASLFIPMNLIVNVINRHMCARVCNRIKCLEADCIRCKNAVDYVKCIMA